MYERLNQCPICEQNEFTNFIICKDYSVTGESFAIVKCNNCGFKFTNPRPNKDNIGKFYESEDYISHSNKGNNVINFIYKIARNFTLRKKLNILNELSKQGELLDIGCGTGDFLYVCKTNGWNISGVEPDEKARKIASNLNKSNILKNIFDLKDKNKFDAITLWHVLEHVTDLNAYIEQIKQLINKKGKILIAVPNANSYDASYFKEYWAAYDLPRHLYHFTPETLKLLCKKHDLKIKKIIPLKLDAYYISLLSYKYQTGARSFIKALILGFHSNKWARENKNNYSSLIYVVKK